MIYGGVKELLMEEARRKGICLEGYDRMRSSDLGGLIGYYLQVPDWGLGLDFPSLETLRREFSDIEDRGVFVDRVFDGELLDEKTAYVFHHCGGWIRTGVNLDLQSYPRLYCANGCDMRIVCEQEFPSVQTFDIDTFGDSEKIETRGCGSVVFKINRHEITGL